MELCYMVSISVLEQILESQATSHTAYSLLSNRETVTVVHYGPEGVIHQFAFPVVYRIPEVPEDEGTMMLMVATERSREFKSFWLPLESKLSHCCSTTPLA
jgi:hypothetical protein